uniref:tryptophan--tRNA ligase n=1 Tax=Macrostomum lignano TaxID=282301 RepID=A0A1I8H2C6_9PLAT
FQRMRSAAWHRLPRLSQFRPRSLASSSCPDSPVFRPRLLSGIQPTGVPHLGNYLGAVSHWVRLTRQDGADRPWSPPSLFCVVDLHALTACPEPAKLRQLTLETAASLIACGLLDSPGVRLFCQSQVAGHTELQWLLSAICPISKLQHLPNWREKPYNNAAIFTYPLLQTADILLYRATHVPVGEDQLMHVELSRELAARFNTRYNCSMFPLPEPLLPCGAAAVAARVRSLRDPTKKMSKSDPTAASRIGLADSDDEIWTKLRSAVTDSTPGVSYDPEQRPGLANLIDLLAALTDCPPAEVLVRHGPVENKLALKRLLADSLLERLRPIRRRFAELLAPPDGPAEVARLLRQGREAAEAEAAATIAEPDDEEQQFLKPTAPPPQPLLEQQQQQQQQQQRELEQQLLVPQPPRPRDSLPRRRRSPTPAETPAGGQRAAGLRLESSCLAKPGWRLPLLLLRRQGLPLRRCRLTAASSLGAAGALRTADSGDEINLELTLRRSLASPPPAWAAAAAAAAAASLAAKDIGVAELSDCADVADCADSADCADVADCADWSSPRPDAPGATSSSTFDESDDRCLRLAQAAVRGEAVRLPAAPLHLQDQRHVGRCVGSQLLLPLKAAAVEPALRTLLFCWRIAELTGDAVTLLIFADAASADDFNGVIVELPPRPPLLFPFQAALLEAKLPPLSHSRSSAVQSWMSFRSSRYLADSVGSSSVSCVGTAKLTEAAQLRLLKPPSMLQSPRKSRITGSSIRNGLSELGFKLKATDSPDGVIGATLMRSRCTLGSLGRLEEPEVEPAVACALRDITVVDEVGTWSANASAVLSSASSADDWLLHIAWTSVSVTWELLSPLSDLVPIVEAATSSAIGSSAAARPRRSAPAAVAAGLAAAAAAALMRRRTRILRRAALALPVRGAGVSQQTVDVTPSSRLTSPVGCLQREQQHLLHRLWAVRLGADEMACELESPTAHAAIECRVVDSLDADVEGGVQQASVRRIDLLFETKGSPGKPAAASQVLASVWNQTVEVDELLTSRELGRLPKIAASVSSGTHSTTVFCVLTTRPTLAATATSLSSCRWAPSTVEDSRARQMPRWSSSLVVPGFFGTATMCAVVHSLGAASPKSTRFITLATSAATQGMRSASMGTSSGPSAFPPGDCWASLTTSAALTGATLKLSSAGNGVSGGSVRLSGSGGGGALTMAAKNSRSSFLRSSGVSPARFSRLRRFRPSVDGGPGHAPSGIGPSGRDSLNGVIDRRLLALQVDSRQSCLCLAGWSPAQAEPLQIFPSCLNRGVVLPDRLPTLSRLHHRDCLLRGGSDCSEHFRILRTSTLVAQRDVKGASKATLHIGGSERAVVAPRWPFRRTVERIAKVEVADEEPEIGPQSQQRDGAAVDGATTLTETHEHLPRCRRVGYQNVIAARGHLLDADLVYFVDLFQEPDELISFHRSRALGSSDI